MTHGLVWRHNTTCVLVLVSWWRLMLTESAEQTTGRRPQGQSPLSNTSTRHFSPGKSLTPIKVVLTTNTATSRQQSQICLPASDVEWPAGRAPVIACTTVERLIVRPSATTKKLGGDPTYVRPIMSPAFVVGGIYLRSRCRDLGGAAPRSRVSIWNNRPVATAGWSIGTHNGQHRVGSNFPGELFVNMDTRAQRCSGVGRCRHRYAVM